MRIASEPGVARGDAEIDFDRLTANRTRANPLLYLFTGKHRVNVNAHLRANNGIGVVHVDSVFFDGVEIRASPSITSPAAISVRNTAMPSGWIRGLLCITRIDTAIVGNNQVAITQR